MQAIIQYQANDGYIFNSEQEARDHESLAAGVQAICSQLGPTPDRSTDFSNGGGYIQHDSNNIKTVHRMFRNLVGCGDGIHIHNIGRFHMDDNSARSKVLNKAYYRLLCIDDQWREWGQPYYAAHPREGKQINLATP